MEKSVGRKIQLLNNGNSTKNSNEDLDEDFVEEEECEPDSMQEKQEKCMVSTLSYWIEHLIYYEKRRFFLGGLPIQ